MRVLWLVNFSGRIRAPVAYFLAPFPAFRILIFFSVDLTRLGGLLACAIKKNFQNVPQNRLIGRYFHYHDGHAYSKNWRNTSILEEIAFEVDHLTFWGAMGDLVWVRLLFPKPLNFFPQHIPACFRCKIFFAPGISSQDIFPLKISLRDISFWNHPYPSPPSPQKSNGRPLNLTISTISEVLKKHRKNAENAKKETWVKAGLKFQ